MSGYVQILLLVPYEIDPYAFEVRLSIIAPFGVTEISLVF